MADYQQVTIPASSYIPNLFTVDGHEQVLTAAPAPPVTPPVPPTVSLITPAAGSNITEETPIVVDVTDLDSDFRRILLVVTMAPAAHAGVAYLVHDGDAFRPGFDNYSSRSSITHGYRYSVRKNSGWDNSVKVEVYAFDTEGNEG